jgi:F0F1-type ATP synthase assembly protein I
MEKAQRVSGSSNGLQGHDREVAEPGSLEDGATSRPATSRPATSRPATSRPATSRPATSRPAARARPFVDFSHGSTAGAARGMSLAFEFAGAVFLFWLVGRFADGHLGTEPWGQIVGSLIGWLGGFLHVYYRTQKGQS